VKELWCAVEQQEAADEVRAFTMATFAADLGVRATNGGPSMRVSFLALGLTMMTTLGVAETLRYEAYALQPSGERRLLQKGTRVYSPAKDASVIDAATPDRPLPLGQTPATLWSLRA
jgi:hypothetical protein